MIRNIIAREGGYVNHPSDPGGETKFGISKRAYPNLDIKNLTEDAAVAIYVKDYAAPLKLDRLPPQLAVVLLDFAVNSGVSAAAKELQKLIGAEVDGRIGEATLDKLRASKEDLALALTKARWDFLHKLPTFVPFGRGWTRRLFDVLAEAKSIT
jgi:lysozyme family protein